MDKNNKSDYLAFITELMAYTNTSKADIARGLHTSWQNLQQKFNNGDMKISKAEEIVGIMGYSVKFVMEDGERTITDDGVKRTVSDMILEINDLMPDSKRLYSLKLFLKVHNKSFVQVAKDINVAPGTIFKYFRDDDIYISRLFWIAEAYGWKVKIKLEKKSSFLSQEV